MKANVESVTNSFFNLYSKIPTVRDHDTEFLVEQDEEIITQNLKFAERAFPQNALMLCPRSHTRTRYFSPNCEQLLGYSQAVLMTMSLADFLALIHPEDLGPVQQCLENIKEIEPYDPEAFRFVIQYRVRTSENKYITIRDEKFAMKTQSGMYLFLMLFSPADEDKSHRVKMDVFRSFRNKYIRSYSYNPRQQEKGITPRQHDIAQLIVKGFTNQEIADRLHVSVYTVKNHKQILFRKINVKSNMELANYVREGRSKK